MKKKIIIGVAVVFILGIVTIAVINIPRPTIVEMGQPLILSSEEDENTKGLLNYSTALAFDGTMELTLLNYRLYDSCNDAGIKKEDMSSYQSEFSKQPGVKFLLLDLKLRNIDCPDGEYNMAFLTLGEKSHFEGLAALGWTPSAAESSPYDARYAYFSKHAVDDPAANSPVSVYNHFNLKKGESMDYQLGFYVSEESVEHLILCATSSPCYKYGIRLS